VRICERNNTRVYEEEGEGGASECQSRGFPAAHGEDYGETDCSPAAHGGTDIHLQPMEDPTLEQVHMPQRRL